MSRVTNRCMGRVVKSEDKEDCDSMDCQLDRISYHLGDTLLGMSVRRCLTGWVDVQCVRQYFVD